MNKIILAIFIVITGCNMKKSRLEEPKAEKIKKVLSIHGDDRTDEYYWLSNRGDSKVIDYLNSENQYRDEFMKDYKPLEDEIFQEIKSRIKEDDSSVPYFDNGYFYYTRYEKDKQYPIYCRKKESLNSKEEILIDANIMSEGHEYFRVGDIEVSPDQDNSSLEKPLIPLTINAYYYFFDETFSPFLGVGFGFENFNSSNENVMPYVIKPFIGISNENLKVFARYGIGNTIGSSFEIGIGYSFKERPCGCFPKSK